MTSHISSFHKANPNLAESTCCIFWQGIFLGSGLFIAPKICVTAGHHFNARQDNVGDFSVFSPEKGITSQVQYWQKSRTFDFLLLWVDHSFSFSPLRGFLPSEGVQVLTVWRSPRSPHELVISPGEIIQSSATNCVARGTVSTAGSSGAPVVDVLGMYCVGIHLTSNVKNGSRVSGFLPARAMVSLLAEMGVNPRQEINTR